MRLDIHGTSGYPQVAVIGCGYWGKNLVRNFDALGVLACIADPDPEITGTMVKQFGVRAASFSEILDDDGINALVVATPAAQHYLLAKEALIAGKDVFVEKPLALDVAGASELCAIAEDNGNILMVGHLLQYHPAFLQLCELVHEGKLGRIQYLYSNRLNLGKFRREENILWSFAPHDISMVLTLIGSEPESVSAVGASYLHTTIADVTTTHLQFPAGERAHIFVSWLHPYKEQKLVVVGERGMAVFDDSQPWEQKLRLYPHSVHWKQGLPAPVKAEAQAVPLASEEPLRAECEHFVDCVRRRTTPRTDGREGLRVLRVLETAESSMQLDSCPSAFAAGRADAFAHESAYVDQSAEIGAGTKIWHFSHILPGTRLGRNCTIGQNVMIGPDVVVGDNCKIQNNVSLYKGVELGEGVFCGPSCVFTNVRNPRAEVDRRTEFERTPVGSGATIGANATIVCGNELGEYCFIAAGAVVTRDVLPHALMSGVPARRVGWVSHVGESLGPDLVCPRTGHAYKENGEGRLVELEPEGNRPHA